MTHRGLRCAGSDPALAQKRPEGVPQGVNVHRPPALVALGYAGKQQVPVKDLDQPPGYAENRCISRQAVYGGRLLARLPLEAPSIAPVAFSAPDGFPGVKPHRPRLSSHFLEGPRLLSKPVPKVRRHVSP
jgi:hypothetical protein